MNKEPRQKNIENRLSGLRKVAKDLSKALEFRRQQQIEELVIKQRQDALKAAAENVTSKTVDWIIKNGTPEDKVLMYLTNHERIRNYGIKGQLFGKEDAQNLVSSTYGRDNTATPEYYLFRWYFDLYNDFAAYHNNDVKGCLALYERDLAILDNLLTKWDMYQLIIDYGMELIRASKAKFDPENKIPLAEILADIDLEELNNSDVDFIVDGDNITLDVLKEGGLYSTIMQLVGDTRNNMYLLKAHYQAAEEWLNERGLIVFLPHPIRNGIRNAKAEAFPKQIIDNKYFESELNRKRAAGEPITKEDEFMALVPDYNKMDIDKLTIDQCKQKIQKLRGSH